MVACVLPALALVVRWIRLDRKYLNTRTKDDEPKFCNILTTPGLMSHYSET